MAYPPAEAEGDWEGRLPDPEGPPDPAGEDERPLSDMMTDVSKELVIEYEKDFK